MSAIPLRRIEGKYEILEKLGEGGMGAVYKVRHRLLDDVRVIKMMRPQLVADEEFKARFQREARVAIQLRHPNIAHLIDFTIDEEDGTAFIVMEFIAGMTLEEVLRHSGPPPLGLALEIGQQSLRALACLHEKGFVHRDISPDNLMLTVDADGQPLVKLIDLGIAKILGSGAGTGQGNLTGTGIFLGKVRYSSPEQFGPEGAAMVDARGDLYSLGIVLYELLTGKYPIQGRDPSSLIAGHLLRPPLGFAESDPGGRVPEALRALVLRALDKDPAQRFATARELNAILAQSRAPGDIADGDLRRALTRLPGGTVRVPLPPPGSTQDRLNAHFGLHTTPGGHAADGGKTLAPAPSPPPRRSPEIELRVRTLLREAESLLDRNDYESALAHLERGKALAPGNAEVQALIDKAEAAVRQRRRGPDLTAIQEAIEAALGRHDYRAAEMRLYQAEASFGEQEVFTRLHERLGELRRGDLEARRRAERLVAALQGIEAAFAGGDLDEGDRLLSAAASTFGEETEIAAFRGRLAALRRAALEAAVAARVESGQHRRTADDLAGALAEARQALDLDPESGPAKALVEEVTAELVRREEAARQAEIAARLAAEEVEREAAREAERVAAAAALAAEVAARLTRARELRAADDLDGALAAARQALALEAGNGDARDLAAEIEAEARRRAEEAERAARQASAIAAIEARLAAGDLPRAGALLDETHSSFGELEPLSDLRARLDDLRREAREAEIAALLARAGDLRERDDLEGALAEARRALVLETGHAPARTLIAEIEAERRRREKEAERAGQLAAAVAAIDACLDGQDPEAAARLLPGIVSIFGEAPALRERWDRIEELRRARARERAELLLAQARTLQAEGELEAALGGLREAGRLAPDDPAVTALVVEIEAAIRQRDEQNRRQRELDTALAAIDEALERGDLDEGGRLLSAAASTFGEETKIAAFRGRLAALRRSALDAAVAAQVESGQRRRAANDLAGALMEARQALELDPENGPARALAAEATAELARREESSRQAEIAAQQAAQAAAEEAARRRADEAEARRREKEAERAEQLAVAVAAIDASLDGQDPEAAARLLPGIVSIFGEAPALRERWERVEELRLARARERAGLLLTQARQLQAAGELEAALGGLREAGRLAPDDPAVPELMREIDAAIRQRDEESRRQRELEAALAAIDESLERGDLATAAQLLPAAVARFGGAPVLRERWERLEARQRKARVGALRGEAATLVRAGHLDRAARKLRQALELDPDDRGIQELLAGLAKKA